MSGRTPSDQSDRPSPPASPRVEASIDVMTSVQPVDDGKADSGWLSLADSGSDVGGRVRARLILHGGSFRLTEAECRAIPRLRRRLQGVPGDGTGQGLTPGVQPPLPATPSPGVDLLPGSVPEAVFARRSSYAEAVDEKEGEAQEDDPGAVAVFRFPRNAAVLESVLDFVHHGELHAPGATCPGVVARDLAFWGVGLEELEPCCYSRVSTFLQEQQAVRRFCRMRWGDGEGEGVCPTPGPCPSLWGRVRRAGWAVVSDPWSSIAAKIYLFVICLLILASFFVIAAGTTTMFTRILTRDEWRQYLGDEYDAYEPYIDSFYGEGPVTPQNVTGSPPETYDPRTLVTWVEVLSMVVTVSLTVDMAARLLLCPSLRRFVLDVINVLDAVALGAALAMMVVDLHSPQERFEVSSADAIHTLQLLRTLRFLRPMSKVRGFRVMYFTLRSSVRELALLLCMLAFLVMLFSSLLYYLGDRQSMPSIPDAMWYVLVTVTTVGYGDVVPGCFRTKVVGALCAVLGVLFLSMTLPVVVNNFLSLYASCSNASPPGARPPRRAGLGSREGGHHRKAAESGAGT